MVAQNPSMTCAQLARVLNEHVPGLTGGQGAWSGRVDEIDLFVFADERADRVRVMAPIARADHGDRDLYLVLLSANYDRAMDAHYAVHDGVVWCLFVHTLADLTPKRLETGIQSVLTLAHNTGTTFASGEARFTGMLGVEGVEEVS